MNLKLRLNLIVTSILLLVMTLGSLVTVNDARENVQAEVASTAVLALHMLDSEILHYGYSFENFELATPLNHSTFKLANLREVRHLKIELFDRTGRLIDSNRIHGENTAGLPPNWFLKIMDTVTDSMLPTKRRIFARGHLIGELIVTPDPSYEISEIWEELMTLLWTLAIFFIAVNLIIYIAVGQALKPIDRIIEALSGIELGDFSLRLPRFSLPELTNISDKFNVMADTLQTSVETNRRLHQQIINVQENERQSLARELHDEIGQHLTAINVDATAIKTAKSLTVAQKSGSAISDVVRQMIDIVRNILQRLRPADLDELGLKLALAELVNTWQLRNPSTVCQLEVEGGFIDVDDSLLIAIYRMVQECVTNIARHSNAEKSSISVIQKADEIVLSVKDDGIGLDENKPKNGFGLLGMKERCEGLNGVFNITSESNKGVHIEIRLPYQRKTDDE